MAAQVSVVLPTYNRRAMVREAILSVLAQRDVNCELIVVDDGSRDGTMDELVELAAIAAVSGTVAMRIVNLPRNQGVAAARNAGVALAQAELVALLDSDDLWEPTKLKHQCDYMRANRDCQFSQTGERWLRLGRPVNPGRRHQKRAGDIFIDSLRTCLISPSAVIIRTACLREASGFDESMTAAEDYDLWLRLLRRYPVGLIELPLVTRRAGHPAQLSAEVPALDRFRILALLKLLADHAALALTPVRRMAVCEVLAEKCRIYAHGLARRGNAQLAAEVRDLADDADGWRAGPDVPSDQRLDAALRWFRDALADRRSDAGDILMAEALA